MKDAYTNPFWSGACNAFKEAKLPWFDAELLLASYRRNMELMSTTQQIAAETTRSIMQLQSQYMKAMFDQLSEQTKENLTMTSLEGKAARGSDTTKATIDQAIEHAREVNAVISKSNEKIISSLQKRLKEGLDESVAAAKKPKEKA